MYKYIKQKTKKVKYLCYKYYLLTFSCTIAVTLINDNNKMFYGYTRFNTMIVISRTFHNYNK